MDSRPSSYLHILKGRPVGMVEDRRGVIETIYGTCCDKKVGGKELGGKFVET